MPPKKSSSSHRRRNPKLLRDKSKHKSLRGGNKGGVKHLIPNVDAHVLSVATFLRMYPNSPSQDQFYTILRKTKTFQCFYSFVNEVFGNMDEQLFSVLFLSFMITTSGETSSFSFKDFIIRAVPNIEAAQIDEIDAGMVEIGNGLSKRVYEECVMMKKSSVGSRIMRRVPIPTMTRRRVHKPQKRTRLHRFRRPRLTAGKRNIRKTRTNKKYVQTGGVLLFIAELITILFEIRRRLSGSNATLLNRITPFLLLLFFILEITAQFSSIDYFGIGSGGSAAAVASAVADLTALETPSTGNLPAFIIGASQFLTAAAAAAAGDEGHSIARPGGYIPSSFPTTTVAQGAAAPNIVARRFISQLSFQQFDNTALEAAFEISSVETELNFGEFQRCLDLLPIAQNESRFATLLRGLQQDDMIPDSILEVPAARIQARLEQFIADFSSEFDKDMGGSGAGVQCATSERRPAGLNDRLSLQWSQRQTAADTLQNAQEERQFNERAGYFRLLGICGLVLSSASSRNLLRRVYYITRNLLVTPPPPKPYEGWAAAARGPTQVIGLRNQRDSYDRDAAGRVNFARSPSPPAMDRSGLVDLPQSLGNMNSAVEDLEVDPLVDIIGNLGLYEKYDEFGNPKS